MSASFLDAVRSRALLVKATHNSDQPEDSPAPPTIVRQTTISESSHVQKVLGNKDLAALIFWRLCSWQRVWPTSACKQFLAFRPRDPMPWLRTELIACDQRDKCVLLAKLAEQMERYDDMLAYMQQAVECSVDDFSLEERNLFLLAFKHCIGAYRAPLRTLLAIERKEHEADDVTLARIPSRRQRIQLARRCCERLTAEMNRLTEGFLRHMDLLLARVSSHGTAAAEARVFYLKARYDYYCECRHHVLAFDATVTEEAHEVLVDNAYAAAAFAVEELRPSHPMRVGLGLNRARDLEARDRGFEAAALTTALFDAAIAELPTLDEESYRDAMLMLQMLRDGPVGGLVG